MAGGGHALSRRLARLAAVAVGVGGAAAAARTARTYAQVSPELRNPALLRSVSIRGPRTLQLLRRFTAAPGPVRTGVGVVGEEATSVDGATVPLLVYEPPERERPSGALLWLHGGGLIAGSAAVENAYCSDVAAEAGIVVVGVDYRLAPEFPFPAALEDCYAALLRLFEQATSLGVDPDRIAVGGASAGGGLAAAVSQLARDRGEVRPCFQLLRYPMLDDRTGLSRLPPTRLHTWNATSNRYAWECYLGRRPRMADAPPYAAAARTTFLGDLPPAWIGVGDADLFHAESVRYAERLAAAQVPVELHVEPGMYHGADGYVAHAPSMVAFRERELAALRAAVRG